jgi:serine/threonine protein kinase
MVIQAACPDPDVIRDLLNGNLPETEQSELSSHFDLCPTCQQQFDAEASGPQFLGDVARLCSDTDWKHNTPTLDRLMRDMPQQLSDAADEASVATWSTEAVANFLDASENADHLGRLGSYEIVEVIGRGGMGIVLRGIDSRLNRVVAIKVLAPELASNPNARRRFYREGQAAPAVSHDHVVTIHAVDDHERLPYLVMEFVAGESLEECIRRTGPLPVESVLRMGRQAALGLAAAHEVGLVHRDMKPANILLENGIQRVRITDFGLARAIDDVSITQTGTVTGTPLYMSPEQAGGEKIDHRSDLFSLGSVLYTMCTGRPAFRAQTTLAVIKRVCEDSPRPIREVNPDIPQWLVDIIDRLMAKQSDDRIQEAAELAELLGSHLAHLQDPDNVPAPVGAEATPAPQPRALKSLLLATLLFGAVGLGITEAAGVTDVSEFLGIVLRLKTPEGTLIIEIEDPDVEVSIDGSEVVLAGITKKELRLKPGKYQYRATRKGKPTESDWIKPERDGRTLVRIQQVPTELPLQQQQLESTESPGVILGDFDNDGHLDRVVTGDSSTVLPNGISVSEPTEIMLDSSSSVDGIILKQPQRVRRFVSDQLAPVWFGKWYFKQIPEQLYGQNFAFVSRDGGLLEFEVSEFNERKLNQRVWLLIPHQD